MCLKPVLKNQQKNNRKQQKDKRDKEHTKTKDNYVFPWVARNNRLANSLHQTSLQEITIVVFVILDWIFVLMKKATMIHFRHVS